MSSSADTDHADVFASLSDPTRVDILRALWEADDHRASFSALRKHLDMRDSGKFNYHLDKLSDHFVTKTDAGDYRLRLAGVDVVGSLIAGTHDQEEPIDGVAFGEPCPRCGAGTTFHYDGEMFSVVCPECSVPTLARGPAPPSVFADAGPETVPDRARQYVQSLVDDIRSGFCLYCESPVDERILPLEETVADAGSLSADRERTPVFQQDCARCGESSRINLGPVLARHPAVVSFFHDHGRSVRDLPIFELTAFAEDQGVVTATDPTRATVRYTADGDAIECTVTGSLDVLDVTGTSAE